MASFAYVSQALVYDNDSGFQSIRHQKLFVKPGTNQTYVPLVSLLTAREYATSSKFDSTDTHGSCLLYTSPSPRDKRQSRMPSSA